MFSDNPFTRRRQQLATGLTAVSGVLAATSALALLRHASRPPVPRIHRESALSFSHLAVSPDGLVQAELHQGQVVLRDRASHNPIALVSASNVQGVSFTPGGDNLLVHTLQTTRSNQGGLLALSDHVVVLDPRTGQKKGEGPLTLTR